MCWDMMVRNKRLEDDTLIEVVVVGKRQSPGGGMLGGTGYAAEIRARAKDFLTVLTTLMKTNHGERPWTGYIHTRVHGRRPPDST